MLEHGAAVRYFMFHRVDNSTEKNIHQELQVVYVTLQTPITRPFLGELG